MKLLFSISIFFILCTSACSNKYKKVKYEEMTLDQTPGERAFMNFWKEFSIKFNSLDTAAVRNIALDSIGLWDKFVTSKEFIKWYSANYSSSYFGSILDTNKYRYSSIGCHPDPPVKNAIKRQYDNRSFNCMEIAIIQDTVGSIIKGVEFRFLETTTGFRLFSVGHASYYWRFDNSVVDTVAIEE